jgi:hypothetical protein
MQVFLTDNETIRRILGDIDLSRSAKRGSLNPERLSKSVLIEPNLNFMWKELPPGYVDVRASQLSIEFKIKCGLRSLSPFSLYEPNNIKHNIGRYQLMQLYKYQQSLQSTANLSSGIVNIDELCPWGSFIAPSNYDPCDLCSRDLERIKVALKYLIKSPQNNIRLVLDNVHIFGWEISDKTILNNSLGPFFASFDIMSNEDRENFLIEAIAFILKNEDVLESLETVQAVDSFIDIEGCKAIFDRFVQIKYPIEDECLIFDSINDYCKYNGGNISEDLKKLRKLNDSSVFSSCKLEELFVKENDEITNSNHQKLLELIQLSARSKGFPDAFEVVVIDIDSWIASLTEENCLYLINLFLVALAAKDSSLILSLKPVHSTQVAVESEIDESDSSIRPENQPGSLFQLLEEHTSSTAGCIQSTIFAQNTIAYSLTLIDTGFKPVNKIITKYNKENYICLSVSKYLYENSTDNS